MVIKFHDCFRLDMLLLNYPSHHVILSTCIIAQKKNVYTIKMAASS